jgi:hypothetical protein
MGLVTISGTDYTPPQASQVNALRNALIFDRQVLLEEH